MIRLWTLLVLLLVLPSAHAFNESRAPESATGWQPRDPVVVDSTLVVSAHPLATRAGMAMLDDNGSALDAACLLYTSPSPRD